MMSTAVPMRVFARASAVIVSLAVLFVAVLRLAVAGLLPAVATALLAPLTLLGLVAAVFRAGVILGPLATDERGEPRPLRRRHGFVLLAIGTVVHLPMLGAFSLVDPWETHYAEVAREMIERRDFVSPWWANEGFFMSKPVLTFWLEAASMKLFGAGTAPDAVLVAGDGTPLHPEWALRFPAFALALAGAYVLYNGIARTASRRAGLLAGVALLTMPGYALLSHQAITDMPLVACTGAALGLLVRALATDDAVLARSFTLGSGRRTLELRAGHAVALLVLFLVLTQAVGLLAAHVRVDGSAIHLGADRLLAGSPHACGLPGQPACAPLPLAHPALVPAGVAAVLVPLALWVATAIAEERRVSRLFAISAWVFASLAVMAKGPAGLVIPAGAAVVVIASRRRERMTGLLRLALRLEIPLGLLVSVLLVAPWYVAVYARNGRGFLDELVLRHMLGRTLDHLHDTNGGDDVGLVYFVKQLGWATFPWSGLLAASFAALPSHDERSRRGLTRLVGAAAAVLGFALVSFMRTKFHHYVILILPACAMVLGLWLDERVAEVSRPGPQRARIFHSAVLLALAAVVTGLVLRDLGVDGLARRFVQLLTYRYDRRWPSAAATTPIVGGVGLVAASACLLLVAARLRTRAVWIFTGAAVLFSVVLLDVTLARGAKDGGQRGVLEAYYQAAGARPTRPLVAYQLNWKGENFYTGNHVAIFISSGAPLQQWLASERARGDGTFYFVLERGRIGTLRSELGARARLDVLVDEAVSSEFVLVRAEI